MKDLIKKKLKGVNVISFICLSFYLLIGCGTLKTEKNHFLIKRLKSNILSKIVITAYEFENKNESIPVSVKVNGVIFSSNFKKPTPLVIELEPEEYDLNFYFVGKKNVSIKKLLVKDRDSIILKVYMKNDDEIFN